jgi:hypothetical protein
VTCPNAAEALKEFSAEKETDVTVIMGLRIDGDLIWRDIAVFHLSKPEVAHEVCIGIFEMTLILLQEIFPMISPQSGMAYDSEIGTAFCALCSINMISSSLGNFVYVVPKIFGPLYVDRWVSEIQITEPAVLSYYLQK